MALVQKDSGTTAIQLLPSGSRKGVFITNTDANALYVMFDSQTPTSALYSAKLLTDDCVDAPGYEGEVRGLWAGNGSGHALVTEY